jgi:hypothetical protein
MKSECSTVPAMARPVQFAEVMQRTQGSTPIRGNDSIDCVPPQVW